MYESSLEAAASPAPHISAALRPVSAPVAPQRQRRRDKRAAGVGGPPTAEEREAARAKAASYGRLLEAHRLNTETALEKSAAFAPDDPAGRGARHEAAVRMTFYEKWLAEYKRLLAIAQDPREDAR